MTASRLLAFPVRSAKAFAALVANDPVWAQVAQRLVVVSDGMLSFFAKNACEVAQHVSIDDATGTAPSNNTPAPLPSCPPTRGPARLPIWNSTS
jgi:CRISPR/Cas system CMR subunit Cmr4 (Cas7 group RAMP superfamily)